MPNSKTFPKRLKDYGSRVARVLKLNLNKVKALAAMSQEGRAKATKK